MVSAGFFAKRLRATSAAAAAPNRKTMGGAGTGFGPPLELPPVLLHPCLQWPPLDDQPPFDDHPFDELP